jgi:phosphoserine phosphatase
MTLVSKLSAAATVLVPVALTACGDIDRSRESPETTPPSLAVAADPLPSWNDGPTKEAIFSFVRGAIREGGPEFVPVAERIAVFDNDGTLWCEQPLYFQFQFAVDRVKDLAPSHPEWKAKPNFKAALDGDLKPLVATGEKGIVEIMMVAHAGNTPDEFQAVAREWIASARHPRFERRFAQCTYQPMLELLAYLRANDFQTWIVSGGGIEFIRAFAEETYGIPPEQVIGSSIKTAYELRDGQPTIVRLPEVNFVDDKEGKPIAIQQHIGRRPTAAFGNSDGDLQMLEWTAAGPPPRFALIVHHDDAEREYGYDRTSPIGKLDKALDAARERGWTIASMKNDWKTIFPPIDTD